MDFASFGKSSDGALRRPLLTVAVAAVSMALGTALLQLPPILSIGLLVAFVGAATIIKWPEAATIIFMALLYSNTAGILTQYHGFPKALVAGVILILIVPVIHFVIHRRERLRFDQTFYLMLVFLLALTLSSLRAVQVSVALQSVFTFLSEGLLLYFLITNAVRTLPTLKRVIWILMFTAAILTSMTVYQEVSRNYEQDFAGFAQRNLTRGSMDGRDNPLAVREKVHTSNRAEGPIDDANRYAQMLLLLFPLAVFQLYACRKLWARLAAGLCIGLMLGGLLFSYSRGAFLTLVLTGLAAYFLRFVSRKHLLGGAVVLALIMATAVPFYMTRIQTLFGAEGLLSETSDEQPDVVIRGRATEMMAAFNAFLDHPVLGVGPGQFNRFYSVQYMQDPDIALRTLDEQRRAHSLYFEMAAETGIVGFTIFMTIIATFCFRIWRLRARIGDPDNDLSRLTTALLLSMLGYMTTALFLHLSYQRYLWMFVALGGAAIHIVDRLRSSTCTSSSSEAR